MLHTFVESPGRWDVTDRNYQRGNSHGMIAFDSLIFRYLLGVEERASISSIAPSTQAGRTKPRLGHGRLTDIAKDLYHAWVHAGGRFLKRSNDWIEATDRDKLRTVIIILTSIGQTEDLCKELSGRVDNDDLIHTEQCASETVSRWTLNLTEDVLVGYHDHHAGNSRLRTRLVDLLWRHQGASAQDLCLEIEKVISQMRFLKYFQWELETRESVILTKVRDWIKRPREINLKDRQWIISIERQTDGRKLITNDCAGPHALPPPEASPLPTLQTHTTCDVLLGDLMFDDHVGNQLFKDDMIKHCQQSHETSSDEQRSQLAHILINGVSNRGGRFLKRSVTMSAWVVLTTLDAIDHVCSILKAFQGLYGKIPIESTAVTEREETVLVEDDLEQPSDGTESRPVASSLGRKSSVSGLLLLAGVATNIKESASLLIGRRSRSADLFTRDDHRSSSSFSSVITSELLPSSSLPPMSIMTFSIPDDCSFLEAGDPTAFDFSWKINFHDLKQPSSFEQEHLSLTSDDEILVPNEIQVSSSAITIKNIPACHCHACATFRVADASPKGVVPSDF